MRFLGTQLNNLGSASRDQISVLSLSIIKYMSKIDRAQHEILTLLKDCLVLFATQVEQQKNTILALTSNKKEQINQYLRLTQHIQNYAQLLNKLTHQSTPSILEELQKSGLFEIVLELLSVPQFEQKNDIVRMFK